MGDAAQPTQDTCPCCDAETHFCGFETQIIGVDQQYGEVSLWTCKQCRRLWLHYRIEYEYLTGSGRMFTGIISPQRAAHVTAENAVEMFASMDWFFRGGSAFGRKLIKTTGSLKPWLIPFAGK